MASVFESIRAALCPDPGTGRGPRRDEKAPRKANTMFSRLLKSVVAVCGIASAPSHGFQPEQPGLSRRSYCRDKLRKLGEEALRFRDENSKDNPQNWGWRVAFIRLKHGELLPASLREKKNELQAAVRLAVGKQYALQAGSGTLKSRPYASGCGQRRTGVKTIIPSLQKRRPFSRRQKCPEMEHEVWAWFVDRLATNKTRVTKQEIFTVATSYQKVILEDWKTRCEFGEADRNYPPQMPKIGDAWVKRWRFRHNVTHRTINLRYKIPRSTFLSRLKVFWSNCIIIRTLFAAMFPGEILEFVGFDQKPLWFNSIHTERSFCLKGSKYVGVAENVSATRARFTAMTHCTSWKPEKPPPIAILFRIGDADCSLDNLRASLDAGDDTLIQGAPKGSYRLTQVLEFLQWAVRPAEEIKKTVCVVLDWFAPHLHADVDDLVHGLGHAVLRIGGGLTPTVQVGDTHAHRGYNNHFRNLELDAATRAWDVRPGSLLDCSRQTVLTRSEDAWNLVDHDKCAEGWRHNGITGRPTASAACSLWEELGMDAVQTQLELDVKLEVESGRVNSFNQYPDMLLEYDDHDPIEEGMEGASTYVYDETGAHADIGDNGENDDEIEAAIDQEEAVFEDGVSGLQPDIFGPDRGNGKPPNGRDTSDAAEETENEEQRGVTGMEATSAPHEPPPLPPPDVAPDMYSSDDEQTFKRKRTIETLRDSAEALRNLGESSIAEYLFDQATIRHKTARDLDPRLVTLLRSKTDERKRKLDQLRDEDKAKRNRIVEKQLELKIATQQRLAASQIAKQEQTAAKAKTGEQKAVHVAALIKAKEALNLAKDKEKHAKETKALMKQKLKDDEARLERTRRNFAAECASSIWHFIKNPGLGGPRQTAVLDFTKTLNGTRPWRRATRLPDFWVPSDKRGLKIISLRNTAGKYVDPKPVYASDNFSWQFWRHKKPHGGNVKQFRGFVHECLPGYANILGHRFPLDNLLADNEWNADVAFLHAVWLYSSIVPSTVFPCGLREWPPKSETTPAPTSAACASASASSASSATAHEPA